MYEAIDRNFIFIPADVRSLKALERSLDTPEKLHQFALDYSWKNGDQIPRWMIQQPLCDRGTALLIYWQASPRYYCQYQHRFEVPERERSGYDLIKEIERRYLGGWYQQRSIYFNPRCDHSSGVESVNWTTAYLDLPQRSQIPSEMLQPSNAIASL